MPIFDQGYQHWSGHTTGHAWRWLAITRRGVRNALTSRLMRILMFMSWLPAIALAFALCMWGLLERQSDVIESLKPVLTAFLGQPMVAGPLEYRVEIWTIAFDYFLQIQLWFAMLAVLLVGPNLISQDLRYNALPLYFSRPLRRVDYFLGKLGVIVALLVMVMIVPSVAAYALGLLFSLDITIVGATFRILVASVTYGLLFAVSTGLLMLALSSLTRNSRYVALLWMGVLIVTPIASAILVEVEREERVHQSGQRSHAAWKNEEFIASEVEASKKDWRPLVSYTANLSRMRTYLLGTGERWERLGQLWPSGQRSGFMLKLLDAQFPWYWSAAVLAGLAGLSVCILNFSIKSLDRLK